MDTESFVAALNEDLQTEYQSIVQYVNHIATITGAEFLSIIDELKLRAPIWKQEEGEWVIGHPPTRAPRA